MDDTEAAHEASGWPINGVTRDLLDLSTHMRANTFLPAPTAIAWAHKKDAVEITVEPGDANWWLASLDVQEGPPTVQELSGGSQAVIHHSRLPLRRPDGLRVDLIYFQVS